MNRTIPSYLRIHRGPDSAVPSPADQGRGVEAIAAFWNAYAHTTQWRVDPHAMAENAELQLLPAVADSLEQQVDTLVSKSAALQLAEAAQALVDQLEASRQLVRNQHTELAARAALIGAPADQRRLADQLEQTLADAAAACQCTAATLYLLDDDTEYLQPRAIYGVSPARLAEPARPLRGSRGDLEAMVQGVVAIDDLHACTVDTWNCPEADSRAAAAICAVVAVDDVPIGTLWLYRSEPIEFAPSHQAAARLAAAQLALRLQSAGRSAAGGASVTSTTESARPLQEVAAWQCDSLPIGTSLSPDWRVDGMIESHQRWATGWHAWDVLPDGSLMLAIAEACDASIRGALDAAIARAAMTAHAGYRHCPAQLLQRVNDTLWQSSSCQQRMSMLYVRVDPETGDGEFAAAGAITAMIGSRYGYRPLVAGGGEPLCSGFHAQHVSDTFRMMPGEALLACGPGMARSAAGQSLLGDCIRTAMERGEATPLPLIRRQLASVALDCERGAVTLVRASR